MNKIILGKVRPANKGDWVSGTYYDMVRYQDQLWVAMVASVSDKEVPPDTSESWALFGAKGKDGVGALNYATVDDVKLGITEDKVISPKILKEAGIIPLTALSDIPSMSPDITEFFKQTYLAGA